MKLTVVIVQSSELPLDYLAKNFRSLKEWNADGLSDTQFVVISQMKDSGSLKEICAKSGLSIDVICPVQEFVGDCPVWDVIGSLREAWPSLHGDYLSVQHPEFIWAPGRLRRTMDYLGAKKPYLVLGNLRRPVEKGKVYVRKDGKACQPLDSAMSAAQWSQAAQIAETVNTVHWIYWNGAPGPKENGWLEDVFFADRGWLEAWKMPNHGGRQPFQDIYDLMGRAGQTLSRFQMMPVVTRMPLETNRMIHLWHPRVWSTWTVEMRDWFLKGPQWRGTEFANPLLWRDLIELRKKSDNGHFRAVVQLRIGTRGTVTRYGMDLRIWLAHGGTKQLRDFYDSRKRQA